MSASTRAAQELLRRTLDRAQAEEDRDLARMVREQGMALVVGLNGLFHMARFHAATNEAFDAPIEDFRARLRNLLDLLGPVHVLCVEDQVYVNEVRVRFDSLVEQSLTLAADLIRHDVGGLTFNQPVGGDAVRRLIAAVTAAPGGGAPRTAMRAALDGAGMRSVELHPILQFKVGGDDATPVDEEFREIYLASAGVVAEAFATLGADRLPNPLPARRSVVQMLDASTGEDFVAAARDADGALPAFSRHTLMVTTLATVIGRQLALPNPALADLGVAALFHDIGFSLTEQGYTVPFERHPRAGLRVLLRQRGFYPAKVRRLLAVVQHHARFNRGEGPPSLFARIIHVADDYDILTRFRPGRGPALAAPDAMVRMAGAAGSLYDPDVFQAFANAMGPYPPGSLLQLADGSIVVSVSTVRSRESFALPLCRVVRAADGSTPLDPPHLELATAARVTEVLRPAG